MRAASGIGMIILQLQWVTEQVAQLKAEAGRELERVAHNVLETMPSALQQKWVSSAAEAAMRLQATVTPANASSSKAGWLDSTGGDDAEDEGGGSGAPQDNALSRSIRGALPAVQDQLLQVEN